MSGSVNPLAVIASRTNYLFALGPLLRYRRSGADFEIPVYLTDSVLLPGKTEAQGDMFFEDTVPFPMTAATFNLPIEVVENRQVPDLMNLLHECSAEGHSRDSFVNRSVRQLKLTGRDKLVAALGTLFDAMKDLERQGKNRVWAKLIQNRYASLLFRHYFDLVVGNPPHVSWESLTPEWRKAAEEEYKHYGLFTLKGLESRLGGGKKDIAALFTYAVMDHFVKDGGVLAFVVHVSLFKTSGAGEGYRRFKLGSAGADFCIEEAHDFQSFQPFQARPEMKIKTRTLVFRSVKGRPTTYPVPYTTWKKVVKGFIPGNLTWDEAQKRLESTAIKAAPLRGTTTATRLSPWLTVAESKLPQSRKVIAPDNYKPPYQGHAGIYTHGLNGAYFLEILDRFPNGTLLIRNMYDVGKIKCPKVRATIEADLVYPLLRGRDIACWRWESAGHVLVVQDPDTQRGFPEDWLQETHPLTWAYVKKFEKLLRARKSFMKHFDAARDPFYSMYAVSRHTFAPHKVVWMDISSTVKAAVLSGGSENEVIIPEHTVMFLTTTSEEEAHYVAAVLNSDPVNTVVAGYIVDNHLSTHPIENVIIPKFDPNNANHTNLAALSRAAHQAAAQGNDASLRAAEKAINQAAQLLW